jgi:uncharacterized membrane protein YjfL (UPF0719 family)
MNFLRNKNSLTTSKVSSNRHNMGYISIFPYILWIFLAHMLVFSAMTPYIDAQLLSGERRNNTAATSPDASQGSGDNGLLSILRDPGVLRGNLSGVTDSMFQGVEERIDTRLESVQSKLDEIAAIAVPVIIAAVAGIVAFAALIVIYIITSWYDRFKAIRNHKKAIRNMYGLILGELNDNAELVRQRTSLTKSIRIQDEGEDQNNQSNPEIFSPDDLSTRALEAAMASPYYWNLTSEMQHVIVKLFRAVNDHNNIIGRSLGIKDSVILNKLHKQTANKVLAGYESALNKYNQDINHLSKQLQELIHTETSKGVLGVFRSKHKDDEGQES